jgi:cholestenol delta-isomerase
MDGDMAAGQGHPYFPQEAVIPGYAPNTIPLPVILGIFGTFTGAFVLGCVMIATGYSPALKRADRLTVAWFTLCELTMSVSNRDTTR